MRKLIPLTLLALLLLLPAQALAEGVTGCAPQYASLGGHAVAKFKGTGDLDITIVTDPLCWHCRLGHKLLGEYPELYGTVNLIFFPRQSFIGSDMAAWILEDAAGSENSKAMIDFAYYDLKQPKTDDLKQARMLVLAQFVTRFPAMGEGVTFEGLAARLQADHEAHVLETAHLCEKAELPGTPTLIAGKYIIMGYGANPWIKALKAKAVCD
ncbi:hypothetical protein GM415_08585 [Pseudodesulfovibrio cashew]|uniref:Thioredoxin-like fold domain-containing protein n=1 Tax=Pseudodesulfovibrio cashew TaxID=2678688 RepID=A0A6I6JIN7_9BACT|nr:hypothetical protein [Pseudodesulfovibrio cashew]QGY40182.1 hypothetical protein GM415_08585 [Pseudodesulfovibrio cashew]